MQRFQTFTLLTKSYTEDRMHPHFLFQSTKKKFVFWHYIYRIKLAKNRLIEATNSRPSCQLIGMCVDVVLLQSLHRLQYTVKLLAVKLCGWWNGPAQKCQSLHFKIHVQYQYRKLTLGDFGYASNSGGCLAHGTLMVICAWICMWQLVVAGSNRH